MILISNKLGKMEMFFNDAMFENPGIHTNKFIAIQYYDMILLNIAQSDYLMSLKSKHCLEKERDLEKGEKEREPEKKERKGKSYIMDRCICVFYMMVA